MTSVDTAKPAPPDWIDPGRLPELYLFVSFDVEGSTAFKTTSDRGSKTWGPFFRTFFDQFPATVRNCETDIAAGFEQKGRHSPARLDVWKTLGDEIIFKKKLLGGLDAFIGVAAASEALNEGASLLKNAAEKREKHGEEEAKFPSQLKATAWVAGFPIKNIIINSNNDDDDFIGPSIDQGFRIAKFSTPLRMPVSVSLAWMLSTIQYKSKVVRLLSHRQLNLQYLGRESLKGVDRDGAGYPLFCVDTSSTKLGMDDTERTLIKHAENGATVTFCESLFKDYKGFLGRPFILDDIDDLFDFPEDGTPEYQKYRKEYDDGSLPLAPEMLVVDNQPKEMAAEQDIHDILQDFLKLFGEPPQAGGPELPESS